MGPPGPGLSKCNWSLRSARPQRKKELCFAGVSALGSSGPLGLQKVFVSPFQGLEDSVSSDPAAWARWAELVASRGELRRPKVKAEKTGRSSECFRRVEA